MELDIHMYSVGQLNLRHLWGFFIQRDPKLFQAKYWRILKIIHIDVDPGILLPHH
jgi:hypothetical protein